MGAGSSVLARLRAAGTDAVSAPRPKALVASPYAWTSSFQLGGHHLARALVGLGWDVAYISNPISPLHLARGLPEELRKRIALYRAGGSSDLDGHLWTYVPGALATPNRGPILGSRWLLRSWDRLSFPGAVRVLKEHGFGQVDLLLIDTVVQGVWLDRIGHRTSVLRVGDRMSGFRAFSSAMQARQRELAAAVDLVAYTATGLEPEIAAMGPRRMLHLPNGVDVAHFTEGDRSMPPDLADIPRPIAIYVGAMDEWFDFEAVNAMAAALPDVSFVLIGPPELAKRRLATRANLRLLGPRPYEQLPRYLHNADVGLIPFDVAGHPLVVNTVHPLKLYEYLACGLPVVASSWPEIQNLRSPAILRSSIREQIVAVREVIRTETATGPGHAFALAAGWDRRAQELIRALGPESAPDSRR
jgi:glycosyltransferase involved in cell wall biosynthesis